MRKPNRDKRAAGLDSGDCKTSIVGGQENACDEVIGRFHADDAGQRELLRQSILKRAEDALTTAACLGRVGGDVLDAELRQRTPTCVKTRESTFSPAVGVKK